MGNNFLSDLAWARLTASEERVEKGIDSPLDRSIVVEGNEINQKSDYLLNKVKKGEKLSEVEWHILDSAINKYYAETEEQYGRAYADKAVYDLLFNNKSAMRQTNYSYPFASTNTHKEEWKQLNPERITHKFIIGDVIDQGGFQRNSKIYHTAQNKDRWIAEDQYYAQMGQGAALAMGSSGVLGGIVRAAVATSGAGTTYQGINEITQGNIGAGTFFSVLGVTDILSAGTSGILARNLGFNKVTPGAENLAGLSVNEITYSFNPNKYVKVPSLSQKGIYILSPNSRLQQRAGKLTGPYGGKASLTDYIKMGENGNLPTSVYKNKSGQFFSENKNGQRVYDNPNLYNKEKATIQQNRDTHVAAVEESANFFEQQGMSVFTEVTFRNPQNPAKKAIIDQIISGAPNGKVSIPPGYKATDLKTGKTVSNIHLDNRGKAGIEVKTGDAKLERNQAKIYESCILGDGCASGVGANARKARMQGNDVPRHIYIITPN